MQTKMQNKMQIPRHFKAKFRHLAELNPTRPDPTRGSGQESCNSGLHTKHLNVFYCNDFMVLYFYFLRLRQTRLAGGGIMLSTCPFVRPSVRSFLYYQTCERNILKTDEPILMQTGISAWYTGQRQEMVNFGDPEVKDLGQTKQR